MPPERLYDDLVTRAIEFNLGFVNRIYTNNDYDSPNQEEEKNSSQIVEIKVLNNTLPTIQKKIKARPLFRGISDSITRGDIVLFTLISKKFYYMGPLNTFNEPNYSPSNFYSSDLENRDLNNSGTINKKTGYGIKYPQFSSVKKLQKKPNKKLDLLSDNEYDLSKHSDLLLEGRHGNGIRIGSKSVFPILNISNNNTGIVESPNKGSLISLISNGSLREWFNPNFFLSVDTPTEEENKFSLNNGNDGDEKLFLYDYGKVDSETDFDQIIITSDKITFDARSQQGGDFTVSSNNNINFGARRNFTLNNSGYSVINSNHIYLGEPAKAKTEPMVLGDELRTLLLDIMTILQDSRALVQGVPIPLVDDSSAPMFQRIQNLITELQPRTEGDNGFTNDGPKFMSHHHYIETNNREQNNEG